MNKVNLFFNWLDDTVNPITMKEMRQGVKGKFIIRILLLFLLIQTIVISVMLPYSGRLDQNQNLGVQVFMVLLSILLFTCIVLIPAYIGIRLSNELKSENLDLLFVTTLSPGKIIRGKLLNGIILSALFFSASMPFMTLTYQLKGLDIPTMFALLAFEFLIVAIAVQFGILVGTLPGGLMSRSFRFLVATILFIILFSISLGISTDLLRFGINSYFNSRNSLEFSIFMISMMVLLIVFFNMVAAASISPEASNRTMPIRILIFIVWTISLIFALVMGGTYSLIEPWASFMTFILLICMIAGVSERLDLSSRIKREIPENPLSRQIAFLFFSGAASGITFSVILLSLTVGICFFFHDSIARYSTGRSIGLMLLNLDLYIFSYSMLGFFIRRKLFPYAHGSKTGFCVLVSILIAMIVGQYQAGYYSRSLIEWWHYFNPFVLFDKYEYKDSIVFMISSISLVLVFVNSQWFRQSYMKFVPFKAKRMIDKEEVETDEA